MSKLGRTEMWRQHPSTSGDAVGAAGDVSFLEFSSRSLQNYSIPSIYLLKDIKVQQNS